MDVSIFLHILWGLETYVWGICSYVHSLTQFHFFLEYCLQPLNFVGRWSLVTDHIHICNKYDCIISQRSIFTVVYDTSHVVSFASNACYEPKTH